MIRVLTVDNIEPTMKMFSAVLNEQPDMIIVANCASVSQALTAASDADVLLVYASLQADSAYWLTQRIVEGNYPVRTLIVGQSETNKAILRYFEAGAQGFIRKKEPLSELPEKIRRAYHGEVIASPELVSLIVARLVELSHRLEGVFQRSSLLDCLTPREHEVLQLIGLNYTNRDIANQLIIEVGTVKNHVHNILSKLNVSSRREAARYLPSIFGDIGVNHSVPLNSWSTSQNFVSDPG